MTFYMGDLEQDANTARQPGADAMVPTTGVPLRCYRPMHTAVLTVPAPLSILGAVLMAVLALPRSARMVPAVLRARGARMAPAVQRIRHQRRA